VGIARKIRRALRGEVKLGAALLETGRRGRAALRQRRERAMLSSDAQRNDANEEKLTARLCAEYARMSASELLAHFRARAQPKFLGFADAPELQREQYPSETASLIERAERIVRAHRWPLLGYGERDFGAKIDWLRDPVSGARWPVEYHARVKLMRGDGSDVRVLWELNRLAHLVTLGRAYSVTRDARYASEFIAQVEGWRAQNPIGRGANWSCAMEVALRAINLLAAFQLFRDAPELDETTLQMLLLTFDEHGAHIRRNLEFSYIATSNHYLSDVVGLFWLGACLPELRASRVWREWGLREMLREMDKQILADGADCEASTGYHRFVTELFLYSFILARQNRIEIEERYWQKLRAMLEYMRAYLRPDGRAPLIGDADGAQVLPLVQRAADDHLFVLAVGASLFDEARFKVLDEAPEELLWLLGGQGVENYRKLRRADEPTSEAFTHAGTYLMREGDLYLLFNASGAGLGGRGSHGHNDALSIEVSACGASLIADPGSYVYSSDLRARHLFRSTAYHSTVEVDDEEQNTTDEQTPFVIGDEARPRVLRWHADAERDHNVVVAEHTGYLRLREPVTHRRAVVFVKRGRYWLVEDTLHGAGEHTFRFRFHASPEASARVLDDSIVEVRSTTTTASLFIVSLGALGRAAIEPSWSSRDYGEKRASQVVCWTMRASAPLVSAWALVPACAGDDDERRLELIARLRELRGKNESFVDAIDDLPA
jgi:hypothetical protein